MQSPQYEYTYTGQQAADSQPGCCFLLFHQIQPQKETACGAQKQHAYINGTGFPENREVFLRNIPEMNTAARLIK